ncbi:uncharacterized protein LOC131246395 isoform X3 [Magnolia sinica]|uniref:uncharacterized protein LOC131246395 isoform X3 n=1 Tax=Magnolia sinica TaxID=86752 RepID=UPI002657C817|nr:uncharacterized protein LOC131246395 isoform X3 [Magnolia sinica]
MDSGEVRGTVGAEREIRAGMVSCEISVEEQRREREKHVGTATEIEFYRTDARTLCSQIWHQEKLLRMKRRWLMGLPMMSKSRYSQRRFKTPKFLKNMYLLESFVRDDDVSSETVRTSVERAFRAFIGKQEGHHVVQDYLQHLSMNGVRNNTIHPSDVLKAVYSALDDLNNNGLFRLANIASGNMIEFEKTRPMMKKVIKEHLPNILRRSNNVEWMEPLTQLFVESSNFREHRVTLLTPVSQPLLSAASKVLERLDNVCLHTLNAMRRMLTGAPAMPQLQYIRSGWCKDRLLAQVQKTCNRMLSRLDERDELPKPLAKAMAVAGLSLKELCGLSVFPIPEFFHFSPEVEALQNDILKALRSLPKVRHHELKDLQAVLDPKTEIPNRSFRIHLRRYLTEYLFECSELEIPNSLFGTLAFINRTSRRKLGICFSKEKMEEELECVLDLSSQLRQMIWELHPGHDIDQEFVDAYMVDSENDDDEELDNDKKSPNFEYSNVLHHGDAQFGQTDRLPHSDDESVGDSRPSAICKQLVLTANGSDSPQLSTAFENFNGNSAEGPELKQVAGPSSSYQHGFDSSYDMGGSRKSFPESSLHDGGSKSKNRYLTIQDICDKTSLVAHQLIGRLLEAFLEIEGMDFDPSTISYLRGGASVPSDFQAGEAQASSKEDIGLILVQAVKELMPSFPERKILFLVAVE